MSLALLPTEVLRNILDGESSFLVVELWKCGSLNLNAKLGHGGISDLILRSSNLTDSVGRWPRMVKHLRLNSLAVYAKNFIGTHDMLRQEFTLLNPSLKRLICGCDELFWVFFESTVRFPLRACFPALEEFIYSSSSRAPFDLGADPLESFPPTLLRLTIPAAQFSRPKRFPPSLTYFEACNSEYVGYYYESLPDTVETLQAPANSTFLKYLLTQPTKLQTLRHLTIASNEPPTSDLPPLLTSIDMGKYSKVSSALLPRTLLHLKGGALDWSHDKVKLPNGLLSLTLQSETDFQAHSCRLLPRNLTSFVVRSGTRETLGDRAELFFPSLSDFPEDGDAENWDLIQTMAKDAPAAEQELWRRNLQLIARGSHFMLPLLLKTVEIEVYNGAVVTLVLPPLVTSAALSASFCSIPLKTARALPPHITRLTLPGFSINGKQHGAYSWYAEPTLGQLPPPLRLASLTLRHPAEITHGGWKHIPRSITSFSLQELQGSFDPAELSNLPTGLLYLTLSTHPTDGAAWTSCLPRGLLHCDMRATDIESSDFALLPPGIASLKLRGVGRMLTADVMRLPASLRLLEFSDDCDYEGSHILTIRERLVSGVMDVTSEMRTLRRELWAMFIRNRCQDIHPLITAKYALQ